MSKLLLVEDDVNLREIYAARLQAEGYDIVTASDGEEALAIAVKEKPDLVLLDIMMPKISGFDVLDILRSTPETKHAKIIMMTALSQQSDRERGERLGADKYLVKSQVTLEDVVNTVKESMARSETKADQVITENLKNDSTKPAPATDEGSQSIRVKIDTSAADAAQASPQPAGPPPEPPKAEPTESKVPMPESPPAGKVPAPTVPPTTHSKDGPKPGETVMPGSSGPGISL